MADKKLYIDYEVARNATYEEVFWTESEQAAVRHFLGHLPRANAAEVVHAEWLDIRFDSMRRSMLATCSHCKVRGEVRVKSNECGFAVPDSDYCPHCGAKMDGGINK